MFVRVTRSFATVALATALSFNGQPAAAQSGDPKAAERARAGDAQKDSASKKAAELADIARRITGPAGYPECVWLGRRVVNLLWRDDLDTAFRHLDLYDRFGCPGGHIQATFRCVVRQGNIDPKVPESLNARVQACWIDPAIEAAAPTAPAAAANPAAAAGTSTQ